MGGFDPELGTVTLCEKNLNREKNSYLNVIKHELAHVVQHRFGRDGDALLPSGLLTPLVRELLPQKEVMAVLMQYPNSEINGGIRGPPRQSLPAIRADCRGCCRDEEPGSRPSDQGASFLSY